jgi:hypothetical protein
MHIENKKILAHTGGSVPSNFTQSTVLLNIDFVLSHLQGPLFPRCIMTRKLGAD